MWYGNNLNGICRDNPDTSIAKGISHDAKYNGTHWYFTALNPLQVGTFIFRVIYETKGSFYPFYISDNDPIYTLTMTADCDLEYNRAKLN